MTSDTWLTMIALAESELPPAERVVAQLESGLGEDVQLTSQTENLLNLALGDAVLSIALVPRPIPGEVLERVCRAAWYWPSARDDLAGHPAHLLVTLVDESRQPTDKALRLTKAVAAIAECGSALGVVWAPAGLIHQVEEFQSLAKEAGPELLPLYLWIGFHLEESDSGTLDLTTTGLVRLGKRELEICGFVGEPQTLLETGFNIAHYVLEHAETVKDGDTMHLADGSSMLVTHTKSKLADETDVLKMTPVSS